MSKRGKVQSSIDKMKAEYNAAIQNAKVMAFSQVVSRYSDINLKELADFAGEIGVQHLTLGELADLPRSAEGWRKKLSLVPPVKRKALAPSVNTRSVKGREEYKKSVYKFLQDQNVWLPAADVAASCGGTSLQVRKALNSLIEDGIVDYKGRARGTRYRAVKKARNG